MAYRDSTLTTANALTLNATTPAAKAGDDMFTYFVTDGGLNSGITLTPPAGWTLITGSNQGANTGAPDGWTSWVYWRVASGNEPATYAWTIAGIPATDLTAIVVALSGRNNLSPTFITHGTVNTTGNATPVTVSDTGVTANTNDDILVFATGDITVGTDTWAFTPPTNYTERQDSKFNFNVATLATRDEVFAGATGTLSLTLTRSAGTGTAGWGIFVIAVPAQPQAQLTQPIFTLPGQTNTRTLRLNSPNAIPPPPTPDPPHTEQLLKPLTIFPGQINTRQILILIPPAVIPTATDQSIDVFTGALVLDGFAPTLNTDLLSNTGSLVLTGFAPTINTSISPGTGQLIITGFAPTINTSISTQTGQLQLTGFPPIISTFVITQTGQLTLTGFAPTVNQSIAAGTGQLVLTGFEPTVDQPGFIITGTGELVLTGFAPTIETSGGGQQGESGDGFTRDEGDRKRDQEEKDRERRRIDEILKDDEIILMSLKIWINNFR